MEDISNYLTVFTFQFSHSSLFLSLISHDPFMNVFFVILFLYLFFSITFTRLSSRNISPNSFPPVRDTPRSGFLNKTGIFNIKSKVSTLSANLDLQPFSLEFPFQLISLFFRLFSILFYLILLFLCTIFFWFFLCFTTILFCRFRFNSFLFPFFLKKLKKRNTFSLISMTIWI